MAEFSDLVKEGCFQSIDTRIFRNSDGISGPDAYPRKLPAKNRSDRLGI